MAQNNDWVRVEIKIGGMICIMGMSAVLNTSKLLSYGKKLPKQV
jgi:hypothetical protein